MQYVLFNVPEKEFEQTSAQNKTKLRRLFLRLKFSFLIVAPDIQIRICGEKKMHSHQKTEEQKAHSNEWSKKLHAYLCYF